MGLRFPQAKEEILRKTLPLLVASVLVATSAMAGPRERPEAQLMHDIAERINNYVYYTIFDDVSAALNDGVVTLTGKVSMDTSATRSRGVWPNWTEYREVQNHIQLFVRSQLDDAIRRRLGRIIYGNIHFRQYNSAHAPIHIVVEHAHVTLKGVVTDNVDRMRVRSLIAPTIGVLSITSELKTTAEARAAAE